LNLFPLISIVIPSFNQGKYIEQTIVSIIEQSYKNVEIIIIDAASKDETVAVIKKYEQHIAYWVSEPDRGQSHAINKGLEKCTGQIFNWINSDDYLEPDALQNIATAFEANKNVQVVCGYTRCFYDEDNTTSHEYRMGVKDTVAETIANVEMNQPGSFYLTSVVKELGGVNESLRYVFDDELWFRFLCKHGIENIFLSDKRVAHFRLHGSSKSVGEGFDLFGKEINALYIDILSNASAPSWLFDCMQETNPSLKYISAGKWDISKLEKQKFIAAFAAKYINSLYIKGDKKNAKEAMELAVNNGFFKWNRMMTSLRLKLLFA
jgi:glycosyltransferase involved in cell wall biosynthesis